MRLTQNFTVDEFERSDTAARLQIENRLPPDLIENARHVCRRLEVARVLLSERAGRDVPILISSGYRGPRLNAHVGGAPNSDHLRGEAVDWTAPAFGSPYDVIAFLRMRAEFNFDRMIYEFGRWIHLSCPQGKDQRLVYSIHHPGKYLAGLVPASEVA